MIENHVNIYQPKVSS